MTQIDAHHHLWDLGAVYYPWLMERGAPRFFGDPSSIQRDYLLNEFRSIAAPFGFGASVHIQVGAADPWEEAKWVQSVADANPDWPLVQVVHCDLTAPDLSERLNQFKTLPSLRGVRQIIGRAPGEDALTGTNHLLDDPAFLEGLKRLADYDFSFDLQLLPELMNKTADVLARAPNTPIALCHAGSPHDRSDSGLNFWESAMKSLSDQSQVTCKLSGLGMFDHYWTSQKVQPIIFTCLEQFGSERCMFGSNFPVDSITSKYKDLVDVYSGLESSMKRLVFGGTSRHFYRLAV